MLLRKLQGRQAKPAVAVLMRTMSNALSATK
jgi:hypothetical protein